MRRFRQSTIKVFIDDIAPDPAGAYPLWPAPILYGRRLSLWPAPILYGRSLSFMAGAYPLWPAPILYGRSQTDFRHGSASHVSVKSGFS